MIAHRPLARVRDLERELRRLVDEAAPDGPLSELMRDIAVNVWRM